MAEVIPIPASTVILARPTGDGYFEIFLTRRPAEMNFLGGFFVFPGGSVGEEDSSESMLKRCRGLSPPDARRILGDEPSPELSLAYWVAAVREVFEETGVHFFVTEGGALPDGNRVEIKQRFAEKRRSLQEGNIDFSRFLESERLYCDVSRLAYFFHRITPEKYPVRFDTRFYLARLPADQTPLFSSEEVAESLWIMPGKALERSEGGDFPLMPPTIIALRALADYGSWEKLQSGFRLR